MQTSYENFDNTVRAFLSKTFNELGLQYTHSQIFGVIYDGIKGVMQNAMFYIEDALTEQNVFTATRKKSVYSLAKISGYEAYYGSAATGIILGSLQLNNGLSSKTTKVYIKDKSKVVDSSSGMTYSIVLPTDFYCFDVSKPLITHEFKIVQGNFTQAKYTATGKALETVHVTSSELFDRMYVEVHVDGEKYEEVGNLYDMTEDGKQYVITTGYDNSFDVMFGNDVHGHKLEEGQVVVVTYLRHNGVYGNIAPNASVAFKFVDYASDALGNEVNANDYMLLNMSTCISGGTNSDSISFIRSMVGANSRSLVLASEDNYKLFFKRFSFVGYVNCWSEPNSMIVNVTCLQNPNTFIDDKHDYYEIDPNTLMLTSEQKEMIINTLENSKKAFAGVSIKFNDPVIRRFAFICYVKVANTYSREYVTAQIKSILAKIFLNLPDGTMFIAKSDIIKEIVDGISSDMLKAIDIDIISELTEQTFYNGYYDQWELKYVNGVQQYVQTRIAYEPETCPGLDAYGNISLDSKLEIPMLHGGFNYYPDKNTKTSYVKIEDVQVLFI